jgi:hypothetical protein
VFQRHSFVVAALTVLLMGLARIDAQSSTQSGSVPSGATKYYSRLGVAQASGKPLTNQDVIDMFALGIGDDVIVQKIKTTQAIQFDTSVEALKTLKTKGVSDTVLKAMISPHPLAAADSLAVSHAVTFGLGSSKKDVIEVQGKPDFEDAKSIGFADAHILFDRNDLVGSWIDPSHILKTDSRKPTADTAVTMAPEKMPDHDTSKAAAAKIMSALRRLDNAAEVGTTFQNYSSLLIENKSVVDDNLKDLSNPGVRWEVEQAVFDYQYAVEVWRAAIANKWEVFLTRLEPGRTLITKYGVPVKIGFFTNIPVMTGLNYIWLSARNHFNRISGLTPEQARTPGTLSSTPSSTAGAVPPGAIARCDNGVYVIAPSDAAATCGGTRNIAEWFTAK